MQESDWGTCDGESFRIYREDGPGSVKVGDVVGLYYPYHREWFSCRLNECHRDRCPGTLNEVTGFQSQGKWTDCWAEKFQIYARHRGIGHAIAHGDDIMLYCSRARLWVSLKYNEDVTKRACRAASHGLEFQAPPQTEAYDSCVGVAFNIRKNFQ